MLRASATRYVTNRNVMEPWSPQVVEFSAAQVPWRAPQLKGGSNSRPEGALEEALKAVSLLGLETDSSLPLYGTEE